MATNASLTPPPETPKECTSCNDAGEVPARHLSLVTGRGSNLYRHGRYASSVTVIRPATLPMRACPRCTGYGALLGFLWLAWTCRHCGTTYDALTLAATGAGCPCLVERVLAEARAADRQRRAVAR